jgi:hypothetical protein
MFSIEDTNTKRTDRLSVEDTDARRTVRLPVELDSALIRLQADRRLKGIKCSSVNILIVEAIEKFLEQEALVAS